jgi:hypothetical protein
MLPNNPLVPDQQLVKLWHIFLTYDRDKKGVMVSVSFSQYMTQQLLMRYFVLDA